MILKSLHLENFKGAKDKIYKFGKTTRVSGMNRLGKTTIATPGRRGGVRTYGYGCFGC